jgi:2-methylisocitrate lyase-like PEP mutase family enzyme
MVNLVEEGDTPLLPHARLEAMGYRIAAYPLTLLSSAVRGMQDALAALREGRTPERRLPFPELRALVGFDAYDELSRRYAAEEDPD